MCIHPVICNHWVILLLSLLWFRVICSASPESNEAGYHVVVTTSTAVVFWATTVKSEAGLCIVHLLFMCTYVYVCIHVCVCVFV